MKKDKDLQEKLTITSYRNLNLIYLKINLEFFRKDIENDYKPN